MDELHFRQLAPCGPLTASLAAKSVQQGQVTAGTQDPDCPPLQMEGTVAWGEAATMNEEHPGTSPQGTSCSGAGLTTNTKETAVSAQGCPTVLSPSQTGRQATERVLCPRSPSAEQKVSARQCFGVTSHSV